MKDLSEFAKEVWAAESVEAKRGAMLLLLGQFQHRDKIQQFIEEVESTTSSKRLDFLAANLVLRDGDPVIK
jgi:hypothetical protein